MFLRFDDEFVVKSTVLTNKKFMALVKYYEIWGNFEIENIT